MLSQLIIAEPNNIIRMKYDKGTKSFIRADSKSIKNVRKLLKFRDNIIVMRKQKIDILSARFKTIATLTFNSIGAVYVDRENIYVGADSSFICFDYNLKELGRIKLDFNYLAELDSGKNIDDIIVYNNIAYLIDDVVRPLFVFRVDVSEKHNIRLIDDYTFEGTNSHLSIQLINPEFNQWIIKEDYGHMGGSGENFHIFPLSPKAEENILEGQKTSLKTERVSRTVFSWRTFHKKHRKGYRVKTVTPYPIHWAVIFDINDNLFITKLSTNGKRIRFFYKTLLIKSSKIFRRSSLSKRIGFFYKTLLILKLVKDTYWSDDFDFKLKRDGDTLYISRISKYEDLSFFDEDHDIEYQSIGDYIPFFVYDVSRKKPARIYDFNLIEYGIEAIVDFIPLTF